MTRKIWANKVPPELEFTQYVAVEDGNQSICNMVSLKMRYVILKQIQRFRMFYPSTSLAWLQGDYTQCHRPERASMQGNQSQFMAFHPSWKDIWHCLHPQQCAQKVSTYMYIKE